MPDVEETSVSTLDEDVNLLGDGEDTVAEPENESIEPKDSQEVEEPEESKEKPEETIQEPKFEDNFPYDRPTIAQITEKYPDIFKTFPSLRDAMFREREFTQLFPTVADAKEASENNQAFSNLRDDLVSGTGIRFLESLKQTGEKTLDRFASNILTSLYKLSPDAHFKAATPLLENLVRGVYQQGMNANNEDLANSALHIAQYLWNDTKFATGEKTNIKKDEPSEIDYERQKFQNERTISFTNDVNTEAESQLTPIITDKLDPEKVFTPWMRDILVSKINKEVNEQLSADKAHMAYMASLWKKARLEGYTSQSKARITSAFLARARQLVPSIRAKFLSEALGTTSKATDKQKKVVDNVSSRRESGSSGKPAQNGRGSLDPKKINWDSTSDEDIINDNITYR